MVNLCGVVRGFVGRIVIEVFTKSAGSDYALQSRSFVLSTLIASSSLGFFAASFGYIMHYYVAALLCGLALLAMLVNKKNIVVQQL
jgi:hypothetical protein